MGKEKKVADSDGLHLYGWMRNVLHLSGGELITFAIVFRSSQSNSGIYTGGIPYVAEFVGCSKETARKYLHDLERRELIFGTDVDKNGVRYRNYQVVDNHIPKDFGYIPKKEDGDTPKITEEIPKKFGIEEYNTKNISKNNYPPTPQEVAEYVRGRGFRDPEGFADYFVEICTNAGWRRANGKGDPIVNWKNYIVSSWELHHKNKTYPRTAAVNTQQMTDNQFTDFLR